MRESPILGSTARRSLRSARSWVKVWPAGSFWEALPLAALFLAVVVPAGAIAVAGRFDGLYGQDPYAYLDYATGPLADSLRRLRPPPPFYWPPGYPLLLALASFAVGSGPLAGQIVSLLAGGAVPVFTALLAGEVWSGNSDEQLRTGRGEPSDTRVVSLVAGLVTALTGQLWQSSVVVMADTTGLAIACLGVWALARYGRQKRACWLILASAALSGAVLTRWAYALVAIPCVLYAVIILTASRRRQAITHAILASIVGAMILGPLLVPVLHALLVGDSPAAPFATDLQVYAWNPLYATRRTFVTADGVLSYNLPNGLYYAVAPARPFFFTPILAWLVLPGLWSTARRRTAAAWLIVGWVGIVFAFHAGAAWQNFRFTLAFLPPLAILVGVGALTVGRRTQQIHHRLLRAALPVMLAFGMSWMVVSGVTLTRGFVERKDADLSTVHWLRARLPPNARLLTFGFTLTLRQYTGFETVDLSETDPSTVSGLLAGGTPTYLFVDVDNLETQWRDRAPSVNYRWLLADPGLDRMGRSETYTLFRVRLPAGSIARGR